MCFGTKRRRRETAGGDSGTPFGGTKSFTEVQKLHVEGFVQQMCLPIEDPPHVHMCMPTARCGTFDLGDWECS